jgi:hypothetical protein
MVIADVCGSLNGGGIDKRDEFAYVPLPRDECVDPTLGYLSRRDSREQHGVTRRQETITPGYITTDDFGDDGTECHLHIREDLTNSNDQ